MIKLLSACGAALTAWPLRCLGVGALDGLAPSDRIKPKLDKNPAKCYYKHGFIDTGLAAGAGPFVLPRAVIACRYRKGKARVLA